MIRDLARLRVKKEFIENFLSVDFDVSNEQIARCVECPLEWVEAIRDGADDWIEAEIKDLEKRYEYIKFVLIIKICMDGFTAERYGKMGLSLTYKPSGEKFILKTYMDGENVVVDLEECSSSEVFVD